MKVKKLEEGKPSWTAEVSATYRAAESDRPENEMVCYDPLSKYFLGALFTAVGKSPIFIRRIFFLSDCTPGYWIYVG